jgi:catechol 2,3-dioxygenase-like lactoylglutathione lyase family enzyme
MRKSIGTCLVFATGLAVGIFLNQPGSAQTKTSGLRLNHVGIYAKDFDESMRFYTQTMGFREAFTVRSPDGKPTLAYLHITSDTFLELAPANADRPVGLSHIGIWPEDLTASLAALRQRGVKVDDPRTGANKTAITNVTDPNGVRLEFLDFLEGSLPRQAMEAAKK